jgi:two-component system chemotaxis sensor kinase CheA
MTTEQSIVGDESYADMLPDFLDEADQHLHQLSEHLLKLDEELKATGTSRFDSAGLNEMFRAAHTIKGLSGMLGLQNINALTHKVENVFDAARSNELELTGDVVEVVFESIDRLAEMLARLRNGQDDAVDCGAVLEDIATVLERSPAESSPTLQPADAQVGSVPALGPLSESPESAVAQQCADDVFANVQDDADLTSKYIPIFVDEAELTVDELTEALLAGADANVTEKVLVLCHRIKGAAATVGLRRAAKLAHHMEDLLQILHDQAAELTVEMTDAMLDCSEALRVFVASLKRGQVQTEHFGVAHQKLVRSQAALNRPPTTARPSAAGKQSPPADNAVVSTTIPSVTPVSAPAASDAADGNGAAAKPAETVRVDIDRLDQLMNLAGELVVNKARFTQISTGLRQLTAGRHGGHVVANILESIKRLSIGLDGLQHGRTSATSLTEIRALARQIESELAAVQCRISQVDDARHSINKLLEAVDQLDRVSHGIQKCVMDTRMVPIGPLLARFKRVIRDISRSKGKQIRLVIRGENTELDKRMIDELGDPLIHIVRNSADHGIEMPADRVAAGKPSEGTVILDAAHRGNSILLRIIDDGRGLDVTKIRDTAVRKGMLSPAAAGQLTDQQVYQLIWHPGLSTVDKVTEVSGRGMGMDIVRSKVEAIHGTIELDSEPGRGTTISIKLPLTLAILPSLLAEIDGEVFAMPIESVAEIVRVANDDVRQVHGRDTTIVRGRVISVVRLNQLFEWHPRSADPTADDTSEAQTVVIVGNNGQEIGLVVDRLLGEEDVVVKSLAENYRHVAGIAGASVLGDGRVSLIFDVAALVERASTK